MGQVGWFRLDLMSWQTAFMGGEHSLARKIRETPPHIHDTRASILSALQELASGCPASKWIIGGFSMGASLTIEIAAQLKRNPAGLFVCSALPLNINEWAEGFVYV
jgi:predicted esterase